MFKATLRGIWDYIGQSEVLWSIFRIPLKKLADPHHKELGHEELPKFLILTKYNKPLDLPNVNHVRMINFKIELHDAKRAKTHLDLRFLIDDHVYDFAVVKKDHLPRQTGIVYKVQRTPNHSIKYFNTDKATFKDGQRGAGTMKTIWRGKIDLINSSQKKMEFSIPEGEFAGRYCIREIGDKGWVILKMKSPELKWKERMPYSSDSTKLENAYKQDNIIAEEKIDGANFMLIPGDKENILISRRIGVNNKPINRADNIPYIKYLDLKGFKDRYVHTEVIAIKDGINYTNSLLNSNPLRSRNLQYSNNRLFKIYLWDIEYPGSYKDRRQVLENIAKEQKLKSIISNRFAEFKPTSYRFIIYRILNEKIIDVPESNLMKDLTPKEFQIFLSKQNTEGVVLKDIDIDYYDDIWLKDKNLVTFDMKIITYLGGVGKYKGSLGSIVAEHPETKKWVRIGTGMNDIQRQEIWDNQDKYLGKTIRVEAHNVTVKGSLHGPRLKEILEDK